MKNLIILTLLFIGFSACKKSSPSPETQVTTGTLRFIDPAVDGPGLYYMNDGEETMLFKNHFPDIYAQRDYYKAWLDQHTRLSFKDYGEKGCSAGMLPCELQTKMRIVEVVKLEKD